MSSGTKHPSPARVRGKVGVKRTRTQFLDLGQQYISGQIAGDPQAKLTTEVQAVVTTRTSLMALLSKRADLKATLDTTQGAIVVADAAYAKALHGYADAAADLAAGDASVLANLGGTAAGTAKPSTAAVDAPVLTVAAGPSSGEVELSCARVPGAGAYIFEYKLEPSLVTDPWLGDLTTKLVSVMIPGLAAVQLVRARVRAVGVTAGPWSVEVVGRAG